MARARPSSPPDPLDRLVGAAPALQTLRAQIRHLARFDAVGHAAVPTVLLQGETGTGKGLVARLIHDSGPRAPGPFIEVNCAAIPDTLLEAELFGVEAGAFTDAKRAKPGLFEAASEGTLFLDEIAALPLVLQGKLLTAIEAKRVRRVGAVVEQPLDVKLIAATPVELSGSAEAGHFRADLYHRLAVVVLELPPLRARGEDILVLARAFLQQYSAAHGVSPQRLSKAAEAWLLDYHWPGNVRELSHLLERAVPLEPATVIDPESLARRCLPQPGPAAPVDARLPPSGDVPQNEPVRLTDALRQSRGNLAQAALLLGMSRGGLRYRLHKYGLGRPPQHDSSSLAGEETGARDTPPLRIAHPTRALVRGAVPPGVSSPHGGEGQGEGAAAHRHERPGVLTPGASPMPAVGWEPKPVAVLAIAVAWPDMTEAGALHYEPWTVAGRWAQPMVEKVSGFGGIVLQDSPSLWLVAFGLPRTLEQLPQRAVQAALAIRHLAAEAQTATGDMAGSVVRLAGHLGTLLVAEEAGASPGHWLAVGETVALPVRLLAEWRQELAAQGITYLEGHCWSHGRATPYLPVLDLLRAHCGITPADRAEAVAEKVRAGLQAMDMAADDWAPSLLHLPGVPVGTERLADVSPERLKAKTFEALRQLSLHTSQRHPLVLAVENLHWIDPTSEEFFASLVERLPGAAILCLATYRPGYRPPWLDKSYATQLTLSPLSPQDSVQVVRAVLRTDTVPAPLAQAILAKAQGNPFFLEEIAQTLVEQGTLQREGGMGLRPLQLPATVQAVLAARIDRLRPEEKQLLQTAAVIGTEVPVLLLQAVAERPEAALHRSLAHLQAAEFLYERRLFPEHAYTFKHALTQEVAYSSLLQERRRVLHARIVEALERLHPDRLAEQIERLAHHALRGVVWDKALVYGRQAGEKAMARSAYREAGGYFEQALSALPELPETRDMREQAIDLRLALPTVGPLLLKALIAQDTFLAGTIVLMLGVMTVLGTLISDIILVWIDPRIRLEDT